MADTAEQEARIKRLEDIEAIRRVKYKYARCLDAKLWDEMPECFIEDAKTSYVDGMFKSDGIDEIMQFFRNSFPETASSFHQSHHPEIDITSDTTATGIWQLHDYMIDRANKFTVRGASFYYDEYVKQNGQWKIKSIDCRRIFQEITPIKD